MNSPRLFRLGRLQFRYYPAVTINEVMKSNPIEATEIPNLTPLIPFFPRRPRSKTQKKMSDHVTGFGVCTEGKEFPCPAVSTGNPRPISRRRSRKRKKKVKDESSDSEIKLTRRIRVRGRSRGGRSRTTACEHGQLDSATLQHYMMHVWSAFPAEKVKSVTYFDPLWFNLYANGKCRTMVLNWIKEKGVFSKEYVLVPIVLWSHWSLLIFCHLGESPHSETNAPCMLLLDSLHAMGPTRLEPLIRSLLLDIYKMEGMLEDKEQLRKVPLLIPKVPQQKRGEECGYYVLNYINLFLENAPEKFSISEGYPYFMTKDWFTVDEMESFYRRLDSFPNIPSDDDDNDDSTSISSWNCDSVSVDASGVIHLL